jgi:hypothetical protein
MIEAKTFRIFIRVHSLFKGEHLSANIKLTLHKALIRSVMTYACPTWEFVVDTQLLKLQRLQNTVLRSTGSFQGAHWSVICTQLSAFHMYTII